MFYSQERTWEEPVAESFGTLLRKLRLDAGVSLAELAKRINYSKSQVSKVENGVQPPSAIFVRLCDAALQAGGELIAAVRVRGEPAVAEPPVADDEVWIMELDESGEVRVSTRRQVLAGAGAALGLALAGGRRVVTDEATFVVLRSTFDQHRALGRMASPRVVLAPVIAHLHTLRMLAADNPEPMRSDLLLLASRVAEYAGWMSQEAGDDDAALRWTGRAVAYAEAGRDPHLASFALVRRAEIMMYRRDAVATIGLAREAQRDPAAGPRILGLAARCEAQGHALAGDLAAYQRALDRAVELLATWRADGTPVLGSASVPDDIPLVRGSALLELGRVREAAEILDRQVAGIPPAARRVRARFGTHRALAHALGGDIDQACVVAREVLADATQVDSATVRVDLRELARTLSRWRTQRDVGELYPDLVMALNSR